MTLRLLIGAAGLALGLLGGTLICVQVVLWREQQQKWYTASEPVEWPVW